MPDFLGREVQVGGTRLETYPNASDSRTAGGGVGAGKARRGRGIPSPGRACAGCTVAQAFPTPLGPQRPAGVGF